MSRFHFSLRQGRMTSLLTLLALGTIGSTLGASDFVPGNVIVARSGDGLTAPSSGVSSKIFLDEYVASTGVLRQSIELTGIVTSSSQLLEMNISRSGNRHFIILNGYLGAAGVATTTLPRTIAVVDIHGAVTYSPSLGTGTYLRGATSNDGITLYATNGSNNMWVDRAGTLLANVSTANGRSIQAIAGDLYISTGSGSTPHLSKITGFPTASATPATLTGIPGTGSTINGFAMVQAASAYSGVVDTVYISNGVSFSKYCLVAGTWTLKGTLTFGGNVIGVAASKPTLGGPTEIWVTSGSAGSGANTVSRVIDSSAYNVDMTTSNTVTTSIATAGTNIFYRGLCFAPDTATRVDVITFDGTANGSDVNLAWSSSSETDATGFNLYRAKEINGAYERVNTSLIPAMGTPFSGSSYKYHDIVASGATYFYKLEDLDTHGVSTYHPVVKVTAGTVAAPVPAPIHVGGPRVIRQ